jgi:hypothetical protein
MRMAMNLDPNTLILGEDHNMILKTITKMSWNTKRLFQRGRMLHQKQNKMKFACHPCERFVYSPSIELWRKYQMFYNQRNNLKWDNLKRDNLTSSVAVAITDVFRKNGINVSNKFVRIQKIFTKIYDIKNRRVIYGT